MLVRRTRTLWRTARSRSAANWENQPVGSDDANPANASETAYSEGSVTPTALAKLQTDLQRAVEVSFSAVGSRAVRMNLSAKPLPAASTAAHIEASAPSSAISIPT